MPYSMQLLGSAFQLTGQIQIERPLHLGFIRDDHFDSPAAQIFPGTASHAMTNHSLAILQPFSYGLMGMLVSLAVIMASVSMSSAAAKMSREGIPAHFFVDDFAVCNFVNGKKGLRPKCAEIVLPSSVATAIFILIILS